MILNIIPNNLSFLKSRFRQYLLLFFTATILIPKPVSAQNRQSRKPFFSAVPTLTTSPETGISVGFDVYYLSDLAKGDSAARMSRLFAYCFYTTKEQYALSIEWDVFTKGENYFSTGVFQKGFWVDRCYPIGNTADARILEYTGPNTANELNYANFSYLFTSLNLVADKKIFPNTFLGLAIDYDYAFNSKFLRDSVFFTKGTPEINRNNAKRLGLGINLLYNNRDNTDNPKRGYFLNISYLQYHPSLSSSAGYHAMSLDLRHFICFHPKRKVHITTSTEDPNDPPKNMENELLSLKEDNREILRSRVLALRWVSEYRQSYDNNLPIPLRGLAYCGGLSVLRGYYAGTYRDNNLLAFETEFRLPINIEEGAKLYEFWKRLGATVFLSAVKVAPKYDQLFTNPSDFHLAAGFGLRYMLNIKKQINIQMDYAFGFDTTAGQGTRPTGIYFGLGEAF
jgi:hypothetical protein